MQFFKNEQLFAIICWHPMKSNAPFNSFFLDFLLKPGSQKNAVLLETGHEESFRLCGNFLLAICSQRQAYSSPGLEQ